MVDSTKACESDFMTSDLVTNSPTKKVVIVSGGEYVTDKFGERLELKVTLDKKLKTWKPNRETCNNLKNTFGAETEGWMSKVVLLTLKNTPKGLSIIGVPKGGVPVVDVVDPNPQGINNP